MRVVPLPRLGTVAAWRSAARLLAAEGVPPLAVDWRLDDAPACLFDGQGDFPQTLPPTPLHLPRAALDSIETALCHRDPERFARAYSIVLRLARGSLRWGDRSDPALHRLLAQEKAVRGDIHKMHAFVRFREVAPQTPGRRAFAAWFEPDHPIAEAASPFFARRFGDMDWVIATPEVTARCVAGRLTHDLTKDRAPPPEDATDALWQTYYANIFNPARLMVSAMTSEMPRKYWKNLPEARLIPDLIRTAPARARAMQAARPTPPPAHLDRIVATRPAGPVLGGLAGLKAALDTCRRCPIGACATQGVPGEGPADATLMIVGEQPGDHEDLAGRPFTGPAGQLFDTAAAEAGLDRTAAYVTNAVKHFKFRPIGKRRLHQRPNAGEIQACRWWLDLERALVKPKLILAMGAVAAEALTGSGTQIAARSGRVETTADGTPILLTTHPAYILRTANPQARTAALARFSADLRRAAAGADAGTSRD